MSRTVTTTCCTIAVAAGVLALGAFSAAAAPTHPSARHVASRA